MSELPSGTVTFLFTDVQDSTPLWEQHPAAMSRALTRHDELIETLVQQHNGFIIRPRGEGDSRFVVFLRAIDGVTAAVAIQKALHAESWPEETPLYVRMALHTGEGEFRDGDYYGTAVNRCARLRGLAHGGQTVLSQSTHELVRDILPEGISALDLGEHALKGLRRPEQVFQLVAPELPADFPPLVTGSPKLSPLYDEIPRQVPAFLVEDLESDKKIQERPVFVAREKELAWLKEHLDTALGGNGKVLFIAGGPGRGKTALLDVFSRLAVEEHPNLLTARGSCHAYSGVGDPYVPFREAMGMLTGDLEPHWAAGRISTPCARYAWDSLSATLKALLDHGPHLPGIFVDPKALMSRAVSADIDDSALLDELHTAINRQTDRAEGLDQSYLFEQYTNVLRSLSVKHPLLLILDDMQWTDAASSRLLFHLGRRLEGARILVVCAIRPEEIALGRSSTQFQSDRTERHPMEKVLAEFKRLYGEVYLDLGEVENLQGRHFVDAYLDSEPNRLDEDFREALFNHTNGHPLFTVELLRTMQEVGDLVQEDGVWVQQFPIDWERLPARVEGVIDERIGRLEDDLRELLTVASVEGPVFTTQVLASVQEINELQLLRKLSRELEGRHRLVKAQDEVLVGDQWLARYRFVHVLFQQHLYASTSEGERRLLHHSIGRILEGLYAGHENEIAVQLCHHFSGDRVRERSYATIAGEEAARKYANEEALKYFNRALALTAADDYKERYRLLMDREAVYDLLGDRDAQRKDLEELRSLATSLAGREGDPGKAEVENRWAIYASHTDSAKSAELAENAVSLAEAEGKPQEAVEAYITWADSLRIQGEHSAAFRQVEVGISTAEDIGYLRGECLLLNLLGMITLEQRDLTTAKGLLERSLAIAREIGDRQLEAPPINNLGMTAGNEGDYTAAQDYYEQALQLAREIGNRRGEGLVLGNLGWVAGIQGDYRTAENYHEQQGHIAREIGDRYQETYVAINLCTATLAQGDTRKALAYAQKGLDLARETKDRSGEAWSLTNMGHIQLEMPELEDASAAYEAALDIRQSLSQPNLAMEPLAGLAQVALKRKDISTAQVHVGEILEYLEGGGTLEGAEEPLRVWLTCYQVLHACQDSRALSIIDNAHQLLQNRADRIRDESLRHKFLENIPAHKAVVAAWRAQQSLA